MGFRMLKDATTKGTANAVAKRAVRRQVLGTWTACASKKTANAKSSVISGRNACGIWVTVTPYRPQMVVSPKSSIAYTELATGFVKRHASHIERVTATPP